jgi:stage V sporulation protein S
MPGIIKVSATSVTTAVAGAIAGVIRERGHADVQAIGASAVNQAAKAIAIARGYLLSDGIDIVCIPVFVEIEIDGQVRTALRFSVIVRSRRDGPASDEAEEGSEPWPDPWDDTDRADDEVDDTAAGF